MRDPLIHFRTLIDGAQVYIRSNLIACLHEGSVQVEDRKRPIKGYMVRCITGNQFFVSAETATQIVHAIAEPSEGEEWRGQTDYPVV